MSVRIATAEDKDLVIQMANKFIASTEYAEQADADKISNMIDVFISSDGNDKLLILYDDIGMLAGIVTEFPFGKNRVATDVAWWVEPDERGKKAGKELLEAFEFWAKKVGCSMVTMVCLDDQLGKYYEKKGYRLFERAYMKEI